MEKYYSFGGIDMCIAGNDAHIHIKGKFLDKFETIRKDDAYRFDYEIVRQFKEPEGISIYSDSGQRIYKDGSNIIRYLGVVKENVENAYIRIEEMEKAFHVQMLFSTERQKITSKVILNSLGIEHLAVKENSVIMHASFIKYQNKAILFTAPSGVGKSTQANLWKLLRGAEIINGDRVMIWDNNGEILACGIPYAGSSKDCKNERLELVAIVCLEKSPKTIIKHLHGISAFKRIWEGCSICSWNKEDVEKALIVLNKIIYQIPIYQLCCTPDESAVTALEKELKISKKSE